MAFINHVGSFGNIFVLQIEEGLDFPCQQNYFEDTFFLSEIIQFVCAANYYVGKIQRNFCVRIEEHSDITN